MEKKSKESVAFNKTFKAYLRDAKAILREYKKTGNPELKAILEKSLNDAQKILGGKNAD